MEDSWVLSACPGVPGWSRYLGIVLASTPLLLWVDAQLQFHNCFPAPLLYPAVTIVGVKCMLDGARSFNGKVHLLSRVGRRWTEKGLTNCLLLNTPATTSPSGPDMTGNPRGDKE